MALTPEKKLRIERMFVRGYSLDMVSEWGVHQGWTREEARSVVEANGWALEWSGRLQARHRAQAAFQAVPERGSAPATGREPDIEAMLSVGLDHEVATVKRLAVKAQRAVDELRRALVLQEARDAEEAARYRAYEANRRDQRREEAASQHGTWGGYLTHRFQKTDACGPCLAARDAYKAQAGSQSREATNQASQSA